MKIIFSGRAWDHHLFWQAEDAKVAAKINGFIEECRRDPFRGSGQPEPLRFELKGWWSRRITQEHRFVYRVTGSGEDQRLEIAQCRFYH